MNRLAIEKIRRVRGPRFAVFEVEGPGDWDKPDRLGPMHRSPNAAYKKEREMINRARRQDGVDHEWTQVLRTDDGGKTWTDADGKRIDTWDGKRKVRYK